MLATRKARQTLGKVQKAKIYGVVPARARARERWERPHCRFAVAVARDW